MQRVIYDFQRFIASKTGMREASFRGAFRSKILEEVETDHSASIREIPFNEIFQLFR